MVCEGLSNVSIAYEPYGIVVIVLLVKTFRFWLQNAFKQKLMVLIFFFFCNLMRHLIGYYPYSLWCGEVVMCYI